MMVSKRSTVLYNSIYKNIIILKGELHPLIWLLLWPSGREERRSWDPLRGSWLCSKQSSTILPEGREGGEIVLQQGAQTSAEYALTFRTAPRHSPPSFGPSMGSGSDAPEESYPYPPVVLQLELHVREGIVTPTSAPSYRCSMLPVY